MVSPRLLSTFLVCLVVLLLQDAVIVICGANGPTDGFIPLSLMESDFMKHYDVPPEDRYSCVNGVRSLWVYSTDKPFTRGSPTKPRTEISFGKHSCTDGVWQFEGHAFVPAGTIGVCIIQVFGAAGRATALMLRVYDGALRCYQEELVEDSIYNRWFRVNVIHDVGAAKVSVFIDGVRKLVVDGRWGGSHYF